MKKRILFLIESLSGGGAEKVLVTTLRHLDKEKFDITLCCIVNTGVFKNNLPSHIHYHYLIDKPGKSNISNCFYKFKYKMIYNYLPLSIVSTSLRPSRYDIVVAFVEGFATKLVSHTRNVHLKKIVWVHTDLHSNHWTKTIFTNHREELDCYNQFDNIITVSNTVLHSFKKEFPSCSQPIQTLYNPIDSEEIKRLAQQPTGIIKDNCFKLISVGRLVKQKSFLRLLRIFNRLVVQGYEIELWLIGEGPERMRIEQFIRTNELTEHVRLLGFQANPYKYMKECDLFVCSSISEGYSTAVTEALILGIPIITTLCSGMEELLQNGECGMITPNSEDDLFKGIKSLLDNRKLLDQYRQKAIKRSHDFSTDKLVSNVERFLLNS